MFSIASSQPAPLASMRLLSIAALLLAAALPLAAAPARYDATGVCIHQCSCAYACPCMFENGPPDCELAAVYHLDHAKYGGVDVSGLSMISVDGTKTKNGGVVYLDARATPAQRTALLGLLEAHGEWPGPGRPVKSVPITFTQTAHGYKTSVPGLFTAPVAATLMVLPTVAV